MISGVVMVTLALAAAVAPDSMDTEEVLGVKARKARLSVIDEKCLECHNADRIEQARREQRELADILQRMEKKGAVLSDKEREVVGHFWRRSPLKSK